jgi:type I restriction enzyme S subunit
LIRGGDIAVNRSRDVGIACVIPEELGEANCSDLVLVQGPVLINPYFAAYYMNSLGRRLVQAGKVGVAITHFNTQAVAAMPLPLPPLAEQRQIVAEVEARTTAIDHLEAELDRQITRSNRLRQSALAAAFTGTLCH